MRHEWLHGLGFGFRRRDSGAPRDAPWGLDQNGSFISCVRHHSGPSGGQISSLSARKEAKRLADFANMFDGERALRWPSGDSYALVPMSMPR